MKGVCRFCKKQIPGEAGVCPFCNAELGAADKKSTIEELIAALPDTDPRADITPLENTDADGRASNTEGMRYLKGLDGYEVDHTNAARWFLRSAELGYAAGMSNLASCYMKGRGVRLNYKNALYWYKKAYELGSAGAANDLGHMYQHGLGTEKNGFVAFEYYRTAKERGSTAALSNLGFCYQNGIGCEVDYKRAFECFSEAAQGSSYGAANNLAYLYESGLGCEENFDLALQWYKTAISRGSSAASGNLIRLLTGGKVSGDVVKSEMIYLVELASKRGNGGVAYELGKTYRFGNAKVEKNLSYAERFLKIAAEDGNADAANDLGSMYFWGEGGTEPNYPEALKYFKLASDGGVANASNELGHMYQHGKGTARDPALAFHYYTIAARGGIVAAYNNLGFCYDNGIGVEKSYERALEFYTEAAEAGSYGAMNNIAFIYERGNGAPRDLGKAMKYYTAADEAGSHVAAGNLTRLLDNPEFEDELREAILDLVKADDKVGYFQRAEACRVGRLGFVRDPELAYESYRMAAANGYSVTALLRLILSELFGYGCEADPDKAQKIYELFYPEYEKALAGNGPSKISAAIITAYAHLFGFEYHPDRAKADEYIKLAKAFSPYAHNLSGDDAKDNYTTIKRFIPPYERFKIPEGVRPELYEESIENTEGTGIYDGVLIINGTYIILPDMIKTCYVSKDRRYLTLELYCGVLHENGVDCVSEILDYAPGRAIGIAAILKANGIPVKSGGV